ncbi:Fatty acid desaturase [Marinobacter salarius]|jgi:fatty acid desaturase|uniref:Fatty acid desaturase n=1 Tax=Marinobacter salarius TaxID=1420917 RepID=A0ABY1FPY0_9GAMM|nr:MULTISPECIES: acyl-CoA desaturase [Marinobacter]KXJ47454.1 MAG: fatty acid desaturase [Marinobacter sp. Hex_13]SFL81968.1 Fatty acid desaturase [Marinobacter salarius]
MKTMNETQLKELENDLDTIRDQVISDLGERDARYIRRIVRLHRSLEIGGRVLMPFGFIPPVFLAATTALGISKIIENMEIGHNVMHGQYDWMNDPSLHSQTYEWDTVCTGDSWRRTHNYEHHTYTNIIGKDRDYGYALLRLSDDDKWKPAHTLQFINYILLSVFFQWGVGLHELESERIRRREISVREKIPFLKDFFRKGGRQAFKDYVFFPLVTFPVAPVVLAGNIGANLIRNLWSSTVIFCGHFTQDAETFTEEECEGESKGHWYLRQLTGSSNFTGGKWVHLLSGHLSYQIEHHVFPDLPAHRYPELSEKVQAVCEKHGIPYNTGTFAKQYSTVLKRIFGYSLPDRMRNRLLPEFSNRALS